MRTALACPEPPDDGSLVVSGAITASSVTCGVITASSISCGVLTAHAVTIRTIGAPARHEEA